MESVELAIAHQRATHPDDDTVLERLLAYLKANQPKLEEIRGAICEFYGIEPVELIGHSREAEVVLARQMFCFFARKYTRFPLLQIGQKVGLRDHTTVLHALRKIEKAAALRSPLLADDLDLLRMRISEKVLLRGKGQC